MKRDRPHSEVCMYILTWPDIGPVVVLLSYPPRRLPMYVHTYLNNAWVDRKDMMIVEIMTPDTELSRLGVALVIYIFKNF